MANPTISAIEFNLGTYKVYDAAQGQDVNVTSTGNLYTVEGVTDDNGNLSKLSIAELVMIVGLARAAEKEEAIIELMREMSDNTNVLNYLTDIETKLQAGTALEEIPGTYYYKGRDYSAMGFLAIVIGGATPLESGDDSNDMIDLWNQLSNHHIVDVTGAYEYDGVVYNKAYEYLFERGLTYMSNLYAMNFYNTCAYADSLEDGYVLSDSELINLDGSANLNNLWQGMTKEDLLQEIDNTYKEDLLNFVQTLGWEQNPGSWEIDIQDPASYLPSNTKDLITAIESKMDSLNSFSQQKMIELQSETNKRDQAYDMISNILKSLNTVQVGIVNNI